MIYSIFTIIIYFLLIQHKWLSFEYEMVRKSLLLPSIFHISTLMIMIVFRLIHHNCPFFKCAQEEIYLTTVNNDSNLAACSSPTDGSHIMSNDALLRKSDFS